jgi:hypothetical protein
MRAREEAHMAYAYREDPVLGPALTYWTRKRGRRKMPRKSDIDPTEIPPLVLPHLQIIEVREGGTRFRYRLVGSASVEAYGLDYTGRYIDEMASGDRLEFILRVYRTVCDLKAPVFVHNRYQTRFRSEIVANRIYMPLSSDDDVVHFILGALQFAFGDAQHEGLWRTAQPEPWERYIEPIELGCA